MKPAPFDYAQPETVEEALSALAQYGEDIRVLAGGQSLGAMLNMRLLKPRVLLDIGGLASLAALADKGKHLEVEAAATQLDLLKWSQLSSRQPLLAKMLPFVGHYQTRSRGTVCGSLAHADPSSEIPLALAVLEGEVVLESVRGKRTLRAAEFQTGMMTTALAADELLVCARFPHAANGDACSFYEVAQRHGDFAIVAVAAVGRRDHVRLGIAGVAQTPQVMTLSWDDVVELDSVLNEFAWDLDAASDAHASAEYRRELVRRMGKRAILEVRDAVS